MRLRTYEPAANEDDRLPQAMVEASTEYDWAELPDWLKETLRDAAKQFAMWSDQMGSPVVSEVVDEHKARRRLVDINGRWHDAMCDSSRCHPDCPEKLRSRALR